MDEIVASEGVMIVNMKKWRLRRFGMSFFPPPGWSMAAT